MPDLDDVTTSDVSEEATVTTDADVTGEPEAADVAPDGLTIRDAKIAELSAELAVKDATILRLQAHNYDLLMANGAGDNMAADGDDNNDGGSDDTPVSGGVDELFADKG